MLETKIGPGVNESYVTTQFGSHFRSDTDGSWYIYSLMPGDGTAYTWMFVPINENLCQIVDGIDTSYVLVVQLNPSHAKPYEFKHNLGYYDPWYIEDKMDMDSYTATLLAHLMPMMMKKESLERVWSEARKFLGLEDAE